MRDSYGILISAYWENGTGRRILEHGKDAALVSFFLMANAFANMIGLYELPMFKIERRLLLVKGKALRAALDSLRDLEFAFYDDATEFVWVKEMARIRLNLTVGQRCTNDNRRVGAVKLYRSLPNNPFLGPFFDRYHVELGLTERRGSHSEVTSESLGESLQSDSEGTRGVASVSPQTPLPVPVDQVPEDQHQEYQVPEIRDQEISDQVPERTAPPERRAHKSPANPANPVDDADEAVMVIAALVEKEILPLRLPENEVMEATKERCARLRIPYDGFNVRKAIDIAEFRVRVKQPVGRG